MKVITIVTLTLLVIVGSTPIPDDVTMIDIRMPGVNPQVESNLCHPVKLNGTINIIGFEPKAKMPMVHHILIYGCEKPGSFEKVWNCGEMSADSTPKLENEPYPNAPVCAEGAKESIIYAWAMDAPVLKLPPEVAFQMGPGKTFLNYLVLQVHYKDVQSFLPPSNQIDRSGVTLVTTSKEQPKKAGVYLLLTGNGEVGIEGTTHMETACVLEEDKTIYPFAYRTHAHTHGRVLSGYRIRDGVWTEIGRKDPRLPEMFYNVTTPNITITKGDTMAARCTMVNNESTPVFIGVNDIMRTTGSCLGFIKRNTAADEMCNFYIMYYTDQHNHLLENMYCLTYGPPYYKWSHVFDDDVMKAMPADVSVIPGTNEVLDETAKFTSLGAGNYGENGGGGAGVYGYDDDNDNDNNDNNNNNIHNNNNNNNNGDNDGDGGVVVDNDDEDNQDDNLYFWRSESSKRRHDIDRGAADDYELGKLGLDFEPHQHFGPGDGGSNVGMGVGRIKSESFNNAQLGGDSDGYMEEDGGDGGGDEGYKQPVKQLQALDGSLSRYLENYGDSD